MNVIRGESGKLSNSGRVRVSYNKWKEEEKDIKDQLKRSRKFSMGWTEKGSRRKRL